MMSNDVLTLSSGDLELQLSPSIGGAISAFTWTGEGRPKSILRKCHSPLEKVLDAACFPLVPFVNRIRGGCFQGQGGVSEVRLLAVPRYRGSGLGGDESRQGAGA